MADSVTERPTGGFRFDNVSRNDLLKRMGMKQPVATSTGTTIVGIVFKVSLSIYVSITVLKAFFRMVLFWELIQEQQRYPIYNFFSMIALNVEYAGSNCR